MNLTDKTKLIQTHYGTTPDGVWGNQTADAIIAKEGLGQAPTPSKIRVCIDPGHGMSNKKAGVYDPGCVDDGLEEALIVFDWAKSLNNALAALGIETWFTRNGGDDPCPVSTRASRAIAAGCTHFISIHVNDAENANATGIETLYEFDEPFADKIQQAAVEGLGLRDRGPKFDPEKAVLEFGRDGNRFACLLELGFIQNPIDRAAFLDPAKRKRTCELIAQTFKS